MILFAMLSVVTFVGPLAIIVVGRGGRRSTWPPDRPVEWWVFLGVTIGFVVLFLACLLDASLTLRRGRSGRSGEDAEDSPTGQRPEIDP